MIKYLSFIVTALFVLSVNAASDADKSDIDKAMAKIQERIKPVGEVCLQGDESCAGKQAAVATAARSGEQVFNTACTACHSMPIASALGAPAAFDTSVWSKRLEKGMDTTLANAINGINAMPAKGNCLDCSDDEIKAAITYMSKAK